MRSMIVAWLLVAGLALLGCARDDAPQTIARNDAAASELRIISLSPAMTRIAADLGFGDRIVGRTPWCTAVDESVPVVGDLNDVDYERLARLKPTHVLIQPPQGGVPAALSSLAREQQWELTSVHIDTVADISDAMHAIADAIGIDRGDKRAPGAQQLAAMRSQLDQLTSGAASAANGKPRHGSVLLLYLADPPSVFGAGTYLDDVLVHLGAENATAARGWAQLTLEDITRLDPPAVLFIQPGAPNDLEVRDTLGSIADLDIAAVREGRIAVIRHPDALLPSTSVIEVAAEMRSALERWDDESPAAAPQRP